MRTTVNLSTSALDAARKYAAARDVNLGQAVSDLVMQANARHLAMREVDGVWVASIDASSPRVTPELVEALTLD